MYANYSTSEAIGGERLCERIGLIDSNTWRHMVGPVVCRLRLLTTPLKYTGLIIRENHLNLFICVRYWNYRCIYTAFFSMGHLYLDPNDLECALTTVNNS